MYEEGHYFDPHDSQIMGVSVDDPSDTVINCSGLTPLVEENLRLSSFSPEDLSNHHNPSAEAAAVAVTGNNAAMGMDLKQQLSFELEHEINSHLMQDVLHNPNTMEQANWDTGVQEMHDMNFQQQLQAHGYNPQHDHEQHSQQIGLQQYNLQYLNSTPFMNTPYSSVTPDLLNLLHLPRCSVAAMLPDSSISFSNTNKRPANFNNAFDIFGELPTATAADSSVAASTVLYDPPLHSNLPPQPLFRDLFHSLPHSYNLPGARGGTFFGGMDEREGNGSVYQEVDDSRLENSVLTFTTEMHSLGRGAEERGTQHFATEKQRRVQLSEKFEALRLLIPSPTKVDRASVVGDAINYIKELLRTVNEFQILVEKKRCARDRNKKPKTEDDMESSQVKPLTDRDPAFNGSLRSSWLQRKSKETEVDVRIIDNEVTIKLIQRKKMNCLLVVSKILDELQLDLLHVSGGKIGDYYSFLFNTKIYENSSVYASAIAKKLIEVVDRQHAACLPTTF